MLSHIIGNEEEVKIRRTTTNLREDILRMVCESRNVNHIPIFSGSKAEGLRFKSLDEDWMFVNKHIRVIPSESYTTLYDINKLVLLTMENGMTKPGFTLLKVNKTDKCKIHVPAIEISSTVLPLLEECYVQSKKWREIDVTLHIHKVFNHGPCTSFEKFNIEYDHAYCLKCDFWPANALCSIQRLHQSSWPSSEILHSIVKDGVLFVPIGAKRSDFEDLEWRISFSLAEKRLINSMNHTQFLCYGLLKLFLKEAINANENVNGLLCSYFLKTSLFWEITASPHHWNPSSLLSCFWKCFCRLLHWVSNSYCPNFFIPENNMFHGKIEGKNRDKLLHQLNTLYQEGYRCLLRCPSLNITLTIAPQIFLADVLNGSKVILNRCKACIVKTIIMEESASLPLYSICFLHDTESMCLQLHRVKQTTNNSLERFLTRRWLYKLLTRLCITQSSQYLTHDRCNKSYYEHHNQKMRIWNRCRTALASHRLHQATEYYNLGKYNLTLTLAQRAEEALFAQNSKYRGGISHGQCSTVSEDFPIETFMRKSYDFEFMFYPDIPEFYIETFFCRKFSSIPQNLPPAVYALFLQYLCHNKREHRQKQCVFLYKISQIIQHAYGHPKREHDLDELKIKLYTTWQVLGICQQISGDNQAAFLSYCKAIPHLYESYQAAMYIRLATILAKYVSAQRQI